MTHEEMNETRGKEKTSQYDEVTNPQHYCSGGIECIDAMVAAFGKETVADFCLCNSFKYLWRHRNKNGLQDLQKCEWYLKKYEELTNE